MRTIKEIKDPESIQLLGDDSRRKIIFLLRAKPMNVSQIAQELDLSPQTVYHHIQKLKSAEMVEVVKEERVGHLIESYYQTTAEVFNFTLGKLSGGVECQKKLVETVVGALNRIGFSLKYDDDTAQKIVDVENKASCFKESGKFDDAISKLDDVDFLSKQDCVEIAMTLSLSDKEFEEKMASERKIRELYLSMAKPTKKKELRDSRFIAQETQVKNT
jgi:DNA-binding transcriptional ArsR family regulator